MYKEEEIRQIAYRIWEEEGCPEGRDDEHYFKAEAIWQEQHSQAAMAVHSAQPAVLAQPAQSARLAQPARPKRRSAKK